MEREEWGEPVVDRERTGELNDGVIERLSHEAERNEAGSGE